jgi:hypothetical protein
MMANRPARQEWLEMEEHSQWREQTSQNSRLKKLTADKKRRLSL